MMWIAEFGFMEFGAVLRGLRVARGMSLSELANTLGVSVVYVSRVEKGKTPPFTTKRIFDAAHALSVDASVLLIAAAKSRGYFEVPFFERSPVGRRVVVALQEMSHASADISDDYVKGVLGPMVKREVEGDDAHLLRETHAVGVKLYVVCREHQGETQFLHKQGGWTRHATDAEAIEVLPHAQRVAERWGGEVRVRTITYTTTYVVEPLQAARVEHATEAQAIAASLEEAP